MRRDYYYGYPREVILKETVDKFKNNLKSYNQLNNVTGYILTKYFGWHSPKELNDPANLKDTLALSVITLGMSNLMTASKKAEDRADAEELAALVYDRINGSR